MRISKLSASKHKKGRILVQLDSGELLRIGEREAVAFSLYVGKELTAQERAALENAARESGLKDRALSMLTTRPMSRKELTDRLVERSDATEEEAGAVADELERLGLLNDRAYAETLVRHYAAKGYGPYRLREELRRRGVPGAYWDEALEELDDPAEAIDAFLRQKLHGRITDRRELKRVSDALARRGFHWSDISAALRRYDETLEEDSE